MSVDSYEHRTSKYGRTRAGVYIRTQKSKGAIISEHVLGVTMAMTTSCTYTFPTLEHIAISHEHRGMKVTGYFHNEQRVAWDLSRFT